MFAHDLAPCIAKTSIGVILIITAPEEFQAPSSFNSLRPSDVIWQHRSESTLAQVMACCLTAPSHTNDLLPDGIKPLPEPMLTNHPSMR